MTSEEKVKNLLKWCHVAFPDLLTVRIGHEKEQTLLHLASEAGYTDIVKELIAMGADVNAKDGFSYTPLHVVSFHEDKTETMKTLLENGANVDILDDRQSTPLHNTCRGGYLEATSMLLEKGAKLEAYDEDGYSPLGFALFQEQMDVCEFLLEKDPTLLNKIVNTELGDYPIHMASKRQDSDIVQMLLQKGSYVTLKNKEGFSPIHLAAREGNLETIKMLIDRQSNVVKDKTKNGQTPLHIGIECNKLRVVSELLKHDIDVNVHDNQKSTPLHIACKNGDIQIVKSLIEKNASVNFKDKNGQTPFHIAIKNKNPEIVKILAQKSDCNLNVKDKDKKTALDMALEESQFEIAKILSKEISKQLDNSIRVHNIIPLPTVGPKPKTPFLNKTLGTTKVTTTPIRELSRNECVICFGMKNGTFAFHPCGHAKTCEGCSKKIIERSDPCPTCRKEVKQYLKIFE